MAVRSSASLSRTNGRLGRQGCSFIAVCHAGAVPEVVKACMLSTRGWASWITALSLRWSVRITTLTMLPSFGRLLLSWVKMLSKNMFHARFIRWLPVSASRVCLLGRPPSRRWRPPLPLFAVGIIIAEHTDHFLAEVETEAKRVLRSFRPREYDTLVVVNILNGGRLNRVFEQMGVRYFARPQPGSAA
jgi:hypothetical protein